MAKVNVDTLANLDNPNSATGVLNQNFANIQAVIETLLSRDGTAPNVMLAILDMNNRRIINLPAPTTPTEPARHGDIQQYVDQAEAAAEFADERATDADESAVAAAASLADFLLRYIGAFPEDPEGFDHAEGQLYFNTTLNHLRVWTRQKVFVEDEGVLAGGEEVRIDYWQDLPVNLISTLGDVSIASIENGDVIVWNAGQAAFIPAAFVAENVGFDDTDTLLDASNVQAALEDLVDRTSLGVYDISFFAQGLMANSEILFRLVASREFFLPVNLPGTVANAGTAAAAQTVITIRRNGTQIGTITFAAAGTSGTLSFPGTVTFQPGDILSLTAPSSADTTLRDFTMTLAARR